MKAADKHRRTQYTQSFLRFGDPFLPLEGDHGHLLTSITWYIYTLRAQSVSADFGCTGYDVTPFTQFTPFTRLHRFHQRNKRNWRISAPSAPSATSVTSAPRGRARDQRISVTSVPPSRTRFATSLYI